MLWVSRPVDLSYTLSGLLQKLEYEVAVAKVGNEAPSRRHLYTRLTEAIGEPQAKNICKLLTASTERDFRPLNFEAADIDAAYTLLA
ncbi:hypothetical protein PYCC9005_005361 [Savitreella phatthalungensis]